MRKTKLTIVVLAVLTLLFATKAFIFNGPSAILSKQYLIS
jgi:hypothetical protein